MALLDLQINDALNEAWDDLSAYMGRKFTDQIRAEEWLWPRPPSPRDIVDTGNLRDSLLIERKENQLLTEFHWTAPYAAFVHDGAVFKRPDTNGNLRSFPARPWTRPVLRDSTRIRRYFALRFQMAMRARRAQR